MSSQQPDTVNEYSSGEQISAAPPSIGAVILVLVLTALMIGGFWVMGQAFNAEPGRELFFFLGGLLLSCLPFFVTFTLLSDGRDS